MVYNVVRKVTASRCDDDSSTRFFWKTPIDWIQSQSSNQFIYGVIVNFAKLADVMSHFF